jgi:hypothetical protein
MQRIKNVTSAENLLQMLRNGRESSRNDAPGACPLEQLTEAKDFPLPDAALEALNNNDTSMLDAALRMLEQPVSLLMPITTVPPLPLSSELLQGPIPLASLQADELLGTGFAPVSDWDRGQGPGNTSTGDDQQTGSEDTHQDILRGGNNNNGTAARPAQMIASTALHPPQKQHQQQTSGRPPRQTAIRALEKIGGSTHQSVAEEEDDLSDSEDVSDAYRGKRVHRSSSGAQSFQRATGSYATLDSLGGSAGAAAGGSKKQTGRPLQRKSYDALVDPTLPPEEVRRIRRILSNRESARRSRKRKATQMSALEDELMEVRLAATELENELIEALTTARGLEIERSKLAAEVDMLQRKVAVLEGAPVEAMAAAPVVSLPITSTAAAAVVPIAANNPISVPTAPNGIIPPPPQQQRSLSLPLPRPAPIKIKTAVLPLTALPVVPLPAASTPLAAADATTASPTEPPSAEKSGAINPRRASPTGNANNTTTANARSPHLQSPLRQGGSQVSHRVRFRPVPPPSFFPDALEGQNMHHEDAIDHAMLL